MESALIDTCEPILQNLGLGFILVADVLCLVVDVNAIVALVLWSPRFT